MRPRDQMPQDELQIWKGVQCAAEKDKGSNRHQIQFGLFVQSIFSKKYNVVQYFD